MVDPDEEGRLEFYQQPALMIYSADSEGIEIEDRSDDKIRKIGYLA